MSGQGRPGAIGAVASRSRVKPVGRRPRDPRRLAIDLLVRIERDEAYANVLVPRTLDQIGGSMPPRDRGQVTDLVYGTVRMQRACDFAVDRFLPDPERLAVEARSALRMGAYQLLFGGVPAHAAVSATVAAAPPSFQKLVNAVLRRVANNPIAWPGDATRLSYPDWIVDRLVADIGSADAFSALQAMNEPAPVTRRDDGYVQDPSSQAVVEAVIEAVGGSAGQRVADVCAAPGGKATGLAAAGGWVTASDLHAARLGMVRANRDRLQLGDRMVVTAADAERLPYRHASLDGVLVDAPCSGLGALRRRPDARWRIDADAVDRLAALQGRLLDEAARVVAPGGLLAYSVCTLTTAETTTVVAAFRDRHPEFEPVPGPGDPWDPRGDGGATLLPAVDHDGMFLHRWRRHPRG